MNSPTAFQLYDAGQFDAAELQAQQALASGKDDAALHHLLGVLLCRRGKVSEGAEELERALEMSPGNPGIRIMLVRALIDLGRSEDALRCARRPAPGPAAADLWRLRAEAAEAAGALSAKLEALRHAALESVSAELHRHPDRRDLMLDRARLLGVLRRDSEAEEMYRSLLAQEPANVDAVRELGLLLERANRIEALDALVAQAEQAGIASESIALLHAFLAWRRRRADDVLQWLASVDPSYEPVRSWQLAAKAHDALNNPAAAMAAAERKNLAVSDHAEWRREAAEHLVRLRSYAEVVTPDWAASWAPISSGQRRPPIFLLGFPRSGTTLLDTFLMGHPDIAVIEEVPFFDRIAADVGPVENIARLGQAEVDRLRQIYFDMMDGYIPAGFGGQVVDKMPLNMMCAPLIYRLFPDAAVIFVQRHPCDCVLSGFLQSFNLNASTACFLDLGDAAQLYDVALDIWTRSCEALPIRTHTVVYEEMVENPEAVLRALMDFVELEWKDDLLDHRSTARARGAIATASYDQVTEALSNRASGRWRTYASQIEPVLPVLLPWAKQLGYDD